MSNQQYQLQLLLSSYHWTRAHLVYMHILVQMLKSLTLNLTTLNVYGN